MPINAHPGAVNVAKFGGALFLAGYVLLAGLFTAASTWRVLDCVIAVTMIGLGVSPALS